MNKKIPILSVCLISVLTVMPNSGWGQQGKDSTKVYGKIPVIDTDENTEAGKTKVETPTYRPVPLKYPKFLHTYSDNIPPLWVLEEDYDLGLTEPKRGGDFNFYEETPQLNLYDIIHILHYKIDRLYDESDKVTNEIADIQPLPGLELSETDIKKRESLNNRLKEIGTETSDLEYELSGLEAEYKATYMGEEKAEQKQKTADAMPTRYKTSGFSLKLEGVYFENDVLGTGTTALLVPQGGMTEYFNLGGDWKISGNGLDIGLNYYTGKPLPEGIDRKGKSSNLGYSFNYRYLTGDDTRSAQYDPGDKKVAFIYQTRLHISPGHYSTGVILGNNSMTSTATMDYDETTFNAGFGWLCGDDHFSNAGWIFNPIANIGYRDIGTTTKSRDYLTDFPDYYAEDELRLDTTSLTGNIGANFIYPVGKNFSLNLKPSIGFAYNKADLDATQEVRAGNTPDVNSELTDDKNWWSPEANFEIGGDYYFTEKFSINLRYLYEYRETAGAVRVENGDKSLAGDSTSIGTAGTNNSSVSFGAWFFF